MKTHSMLLILMAQAALANAGLLGAEALSDGVTFNGWTGDTNMTWRIENGAFVGGSMQKMVPRNEFLSTTRSFTNFVLRLEVKLVGTEGFINGGVQIRSQRLSNPPNEMIGYQCDMGAGYWGALYDESRRNKILVQPPADLVQKALHVNGWNLYEIRCEGKSIHSFLNGIPMVNYTENDEAIPQQGHIGVQIHGGAKAEASYRNITVEELP